LFSANFKQLKVGNPVVRPGQGKAIQTLCICAEFWRSESVIWYSDQFKLINCAADGISCHGIGLSADWSVFRTPNDY